ncbi:peroxidase-related enzyme [Nonomuraea phyllanthi]|uniref:Peroxidase-related enzyme n=1 Tax=Nonomuraea phyllanthi TaxID=2219224 RepID=A0A5C4WQF5_9ACTN|nr:peroxidase-related enzyme [Nonomuraea phyllanthi]KAB8195913.1 peroxidase-related enzyme [Nonomuraea phyllanthi]
MARVPLIDPATATGAAAEQLAATRHTMGATPNTTRALANSPAALKGFLGLYGALKDGVLPAALRERIALAVSELNGCTYCLSTHVYVCRQFLRLPEEEILAARRGRSADPRADAALRLAVAVTTGRGPVDDAQFVSAREAGLTDEEIVEVIANVAHNVFANYASEALEVDLELPLVPLRSQATA